MKLDSEGQGKRKPVSNAIAGALSGCVSRLAVGPLDVIKIRFQVQLEPIKKATQSHYTGMLQAFRVIVKEEGLAGLWRGTVPGLLLTVPYTAVQFVTVTRCKEIASRMGWAGNQSVYLPSVSFVSGAFAGAAATLASYPFDLLRTTLAAQGEPKIYSGMRDAAAKIVKRNGLGGLYSGFRVTLVEVIPYSAIQFAAYDSLNAVADRAMGSNEANRNGVQTFTCGLVAGIASKLATHPLDVAKKRFQIAGLKRNSIYGKQIDMKGVRSLLGLLTKICREEGVAGLWKGCLPNIVKAGPAAAVTFVSYEFFLGYLTAIAPKEGSL
ncbi:hypothetical protein BSKO_00786 [Bryopsis sp. KO-2023]|nr:hypothetical protein BSKO_00786 [Bryopsis sp. KO-2023]